MRACKAIGMLAREHQPRLVAAEPARIFQFRAVDHDVLVQRPATQPIISDEG